MTKRNNFNPWLATRTRTGAEYDAPYFERENAGINIHGEADLIQKLIPAPASILDAGCGTGRMGIELARRGYDVVGIDLDDVMLSQAKAKAPDMTWILGDLSETLFDRQFDAIVMAGNVMIFLTPHTEQAVLANMARHLQPNGLLVAAFELNPLPWTQLSLTSYDQMANDVGLTAVTRWATWEQTPWQMGDRYVVNVHRANK